MLLTLVSTLPAQPSLAESPLAREMSIDPALMTKLAKKGDLTLRDTPLGEALFTIGDIWQINLVVNSDLQGKVNGTFKATPLHEILDSILLAQGYSYRPVAQSLVITKLEELGDFNPLMQTATIPVRYVNPTDIVKAVELLRSPRGKIEPVASAKLLVVVDFPDRVQSIRGLIEQIDATHRPTDAPGKSNEPDEIRVMHYLTRHVSADSLVEAVNKLFKDDKNTESKSGKAASLEASNRCVFSGTAKQLEIVRELIRLTDVPQQQVRITALIYDIALEDMESLGLNWNHAVKLRLDKEGASKTRLALDSVTRVPFAGSPLDGAMSFASVSKHFDMAAVVSALQETKNSRLLADPTVTVLNNEEATIQIIQEIPYQELTQTAGGGNIGTTSFKEVGVKLRVKPLIGESETVQMAVNPSFSRLAGFTPNTDQPIIDRRETNTFVRVASNQTLVIGGLRQRADNDTFRGTPYLKDIRGLGLLFRSRSNLVRESELVVFLTPEIVTLQSPARPREETALDVGNYLIENVPQAPTITFCPHGPMKHCRKCMPPAAADSPGATTVPMPDLPPRITTPEKSAEPKLVDPSRGESKLDYIAPHRLMGFDVPAAPQPKSPGWRTARPTIKEK